MVRIAQFSGPEPDKSGIFGKPGDQLQGPAVETARTFGGEVDIIDWAGGWSVIYRPVYNYAADRIAWTMERAAMNKHIGYSQGTQRLTFWEQLQKKGIDGDPLKISVDCNSDCSAGVAACINNAGIEINPNMTTRNEDRLIMNTGEFIRITTPDVVNDPKNVMRGDILWRSGHTAVAIDDGVDVWDGNYLQTTGKAYRRVGPSVAYYSIGDLKAGERILSLPGQENGWRMLYRVETASIAWTSGKLLTEDIGIDQVRVTGLTVRIRKEPDRKSDSLKIVRRGQVFPTNDMQRKDDRGIVWYRVFFGPYGLEAGWISSVYSELVRE